MKKTKMILKDPRKNNLTASKVWMQKSIQFAVEYDIKISGK